MGTTTPPNRVDHVEELIQTQGGARDTDPTVIDGEQSTGPTGPTHGGPGAVPIITIPPAPAPAPSPRGSVPDLRTGTLVGEYEILGKLGQGGMGVVYAATHPVIGKKAAVKVLRARLCADVEAIERFIQEARAVNQIGHPNIVDIFAHGELPDGRSYLVMELLAGESLQARLRRAPLSRDELCHYGDAIARALEAAHDKKIIHRDLKPENVFLHELRGERPVVKLLDFGIAKLVDTEDHRMAQTRTGAMMGTPQYISPEQARGYAIDFRADVYSLGVMLFEMITGRPPFIADNAMDMVAKHLYEMPPRAASVATAVPQVLDVLIAQMMDKDATRRPSLARVRQALEEARIDGVTAQVGVVAPVTGRRAQVEARRSRRPVVIAAAALTVVIGAVGAFAIIKAVRGTPAEPTQVGVGVGVGVGDQRVSPTPTPTPTPTPPGPTPTPAPAPTLAPTMVNVELDSGRAILIVDGEHQDGDRSWNLALAPGPHELAAERKGKQVWARTIEVVEGKPLTITITVPRKHTRPGAGVETEDDPDELLAPGARRRPR